MLATRGSRKVTTMEARANKTNGIRCLERTLLGQSARKHMIDLYLYATSANFTIIDRALEVSEMCKHDPWRVRESKPKTMQGAIEFVTKLMDKKISTPTERQAENKRKISTNANTANNQRGTRASQKATCYECGNQGHYMNDFPKRKNQNHENQTGGTRARGVVHAFGGGETEQDLNNIEDEIDA
ncbi:reverse transcriptase domain-containing protein [Tanacetum coccineum]|uniref:Reverse transcriptase domain-containing protein n=1 Tax=Tanacetum coccineum TaxID=301880 RepID=A0ABQ5J679_9ASTR